LLQRLSKSGSSKENQSRADAVIKKVQNVVKIAAEAGWYGIKTRVSIPKQVEKLFRQTMLWEKQTVSHGLKEEKNKIRIILGKR